MHVSFGGELTLPKHFKDFEGFLKFATEDWEKRRVQEMYEDYVEGLRREVMSMKKLLN